MATVGTEDSNLVFQFNSPLNRSLPACYYADSGTAAAVPAADANRVCESARAALEDARIFSQYNNYLNAKWACAENTQQRAHEQLLQDRRLKLEELVDKFWLKDGEIDESIFEDSSDEEGL